MKKQQGEALTGTARRGRRAKTRRTRRRRTRTRITCFGKPEPKRNIERTKKGENEEKKPRV